MIYFKKKIIVWTPYFGSIRFPFEDELDFNLKNDFIYKIKNDLESPLIFVLFLKG